jgi:hypothetical protein
MWFKVSGSYLVQKILRRIDNAIIKKMWAGFTEQDKEWFKNDKLNHINMITSHGVLTNSGLDEEVWLGMTTRLNHLF